MRKIIQELAYGRFPQQKPIVEFSAKCLEFEVQAGDRYQGSFSMTSVNGQQMRGVVYASNGRVKCSVADFSGSSATIPFEFQSKGLMEGDVLKGEFHIICNGGEYSLPFTASVKRVYPKTSIGIIKNLFDFANLAQQSYDEALRIFQSDCFWNLFRENELQEQLLYRGLGGKKASAQEMEEFLIGIRKKQRVRFEVEERQWEISGVQGEQKELLRIRKRSWGYLEIEIASDHEAAEPLRKRIAMEDFVGNSAEVPFVIREEKLHRGNNYVRLTLESLGQTEACEFCIRREQAQEHSDKSGEQAERKRHLMELASLYLSYRRKKIVTGMWTKETCHHLERLREMEPGNPWYVLYHAQALIINKQRQDAEWLLDDFRQRQVSKDTTLYAYYLYVCTLQERDPSYVAKLAARIREVYQSNQEHPGMFLMVLFTDPELNHSSSRKFQAIEGRVLSGGHSPLLYMEAFCLIQGEPHLLQKAGAFERQVLYWAARRHMLNKKLNRQVRKLAALFRPQEQELSRRRSSELRMWYRILQECYRIESGKENLQAICSFCIKWNLLSPEEMVWYEKGVKDDLRLAGLYEAWISCASGTEQIQQFPKSVMLYFQYRSNLSCQKQALLYAAIVKKKDRRPDIYESYRKSIEEFAIQQLLEGRIDENLAVLYRDLLAQQAPGKKIAEKLAELMYQCRISCKDGRAVRVIVLHRQQEQEQTVDFAGGKAYVQIYSGDHCILLEDAAGRRYIPSEGFCKEQLLAAEEYVADCIACGARDFSHLICYFDARKIWHSYLDTDMELLAELLECPITMSYRKELKIQMTEYYNHTFTGDALEDYLCKVDCEGLGRDTRNRLLELMVAQGIYDKAYSVLLDYGNEEASIRKLLVIAAYQIAVSNDGYEEALLDLCHTIFQRGKYNESVLRYLCSYFNGTVRQMEELWAAAREFDLDTYELEERFLVQLLYTESYTRRTGEIFDSYFENQGQEMVIMAYFSWFSYQYFVKHALEPEGMFLHLERQVQLGNPLNDACRLACLRWLATKRKHTKEQDKLLEELLSEFVSQQKYFSFYQELPQHLQRKYHLQDRVILERGAEPGRRMMIYYLLPGRQEYCVETMEKMYEGIFAKKFVVFFGEDIPYYLKEEDEAGAHITESGHIQMDDLLSQGDGSCYDLINGMMTSYHLGDRQTLLRLSGQYHYKEQLAEEQFQLL